MARLNAGEKRRNDRQISSMEEAIHFVSGDSYSMKIFFKVSVIIIRREGHRCGTEVGCISKLQVEMLQHESSVKLNPAS